MNYLFLDPGVTIGKVHIIFSICLATVLILIFFLNRVIVKNINNKAIIKSLKRSREGSLYFGIVFYLFVFFWLEEVPFLGKRIWFYLFLIGFFVWVFYKVKYFLKINKRIKKRRENV